MSRRKSLTDRQIAALKPRAKRYALPDPELTGHYIRVMPSGAKTFTTVARNPAGKQVWTALGDCAVIKIEEAREDAREAIKRVRAGLTAIEIPPERFESVIANWRKRYAEPEGLRSLREVNRMLDSHLLPAWKDRVFVDIKRSDIAKLMDEVQDAHGARAADYCLTTFSMIATWVAARSDDYNSPIQRGMRRQKISEQARDRVLDDDELRVVWKACSDEKAGTFGAIIRFALLTGQRRARICEMKWDELDSDVWTMPLAKREKQNGGKFRLPAPALELIKARPHLEGNPYVFYGRGTRDKKTDEMKPGFFRGVGQAKAVVDARIKKELPEMPGWTVHDCRRSARTLMSRAGVDSDTAERVLGHVEPGVAGTYDRYAYFDEKSAALAKLAALIQTIINPPAANVVPMKKKRSR